MISELLTPDYIFEASWEVCNKVGGIYTVLSTRANTLQAKFHDRILFVGPDFWQGKENPLFMESDNLCAAWKKHAAENDNLSVRVGRWNIPGEPIVILVDFQPFFAKKNEIYTEMWNRYQVDSLHAYGDYDEASMFSYAAGKVVESFYRYNLTENDATPVFLLMKQAISTGWDCPRAKILVKLREGMSEGFEIQTIGRIRRMPEARHYEDDLLDFCYVYTFDEKYKAGLLSSMDKAYETRRLFLKDKCKTFTLEKEIRDMDFDGLGEREVLFKIHETLVAKYHLGSDKKQNQRLLADAGYIFGAEIHGQALQGEFVRTSALTESHSYITTHKRVETHKHGMQLMHSIDAIKSSIGMAQNKVKTILERLFRKGGNSSWKLIALGTAEFYAFIINNQHKLKEEFREVTAQMAVQTSMQLHPKKSTFHIPEQDFFRYDPNVKSEVEYLSNAYHEYTSGFATSLVRSTCEMLFEQHCEGRQDIEWVYKNGDTGQQYFSIVYVDGIQKQWLFYADYIVMKKDGTVWVIETKGGETKGQDKNIDRQIENKFNAFKAYATKHNLHWGFVRDKDNQLYINNTEFAVDMADEHWVPLLQEF